MAAYTTPNLDTPMYFPLALLSIARGNDSIFGLNDMETREVFYPYLRVEYRESVSIEFYSEIRRSILHPPYMSYSKIPDSTINPIEEAQRNIYAVVKSQKNLSSLVEILMLATIKISNEARVNIEYALQEDYTTVPNMDGFEIYAKNTNQMEGKPFSKSDYTSLDYLYYNEELSCIAFCKYIDSLHNKFLDDGICKQLNLSFINFLSMEGKMKGTLLYSDFVYSKNRREKDVTINSLESKFQNITLPPQRKARETFFNLLFMLYQKMQNGCITKGKIPIENPFVYPDTQLTSIDFLQEEELKKIGDFIINTVCKTKD